MQNIEIEVCEDAVNERFLPYLTQYYRYELYWGGRDSSKSDYVALKLLLKCLYEQYFLCILIRDVYETIKDSQWATLKKVAEREGLEQFFFFGTSPLEIRCLLNKNKFIARGMDDASKLKSVSDPTTAWYEEANQIDEDSHTIVSTSLRTSYNVPIQEYFTCNPDIEGDYKEFWLFKKFFINTGHEHDTTFEGTIDVEVEGQLVRQSYLVHHSTIYDNRWAPAERKATYLGYKGTDAYKYRVWGQGLWATRRTGNEFYSKFKEEDHVKKVEYLPGKSSLQSWDFNALPYMPLICAQLLPPEETKSKKWQIRIYKEFAMRPPDNTTKAACIAYKNYHQQFQPRPAVFFYGDASAKNRDPGYGDVRKFDAVVENMAGWLNNASDKVARRNPGVFKRRDAINDIFEGSANIEIVIDESCKELINDLKMVKTSVEHDGKHKQYYNDKAMGVKYQLVSHFSDAFDYLVTGLFPGIIK